MAEKFLPVGGIRFAGPLCRAEMCRHRDGVGAEEQRDNRLQGSHADGQCFSKGWAPVLSQVEAKGVGLQGAPLLRFKERESS